MALGGRGGALGAQITGTLPVIMPAPAAGGIVASGVVTQTKSNGPPRSFTTEKLGPQVMEGELAEGQREVMIIPTGLQGNDRDIRVVTESWTAPDLRIVVYRKSSDPRSGDNIMRLSNISRNEPDPQLFLPPADYQVVEETGPFTIHYAQ